uniref:Uncharacterized protein n=1 Tax=Mycena chlorophos TaxID=658473 RepID=A0ABQ0KYT7_MYCCL|nr:predicted protein [Mycena chlorophos]
MYQHSLTKLAALSLPCESLAALVRKLQDEEKQTDRLQSPIGPLVMQLADEREFVIAFGKTLVGGANGRLCLYEQWSDAAADLAHHHINFHVKPRVLI